MRFIRALSVIRVSSPPCGREEGSEADAGRWKCLRGSVEDYSGGVSQSDLYQLYAYAHRYDSTNNVLLFPKVPGLESRSYSLAGDESKWLRVEFIDVSQDLWKGRSRLTNAFRRILVDAGSAVDQIS